jgi:hypothetical protein
VTTDLISRLYRHADGGTVDPLRRLPGHDQRLTGTGELCRPDLAPRAAVGQARRSGSGRPDRDSRTPSGKLPADRAAAASHLKSAAAVLGRGFRVGPPTGIAVSHVSQLAYRRGRTNPHEQPWSVSSSHQFSGVTQMFEKTLRHWIQSSMFEGHDSDDPFPNRQL